MLFLSISLIDLTRDPIGLANYSHISNEIFFRFCSTLLSHMVPYCLIWFPIVPPCFFCPTWFPIVPYGSLLFHMALQCSIWLSIVPYGSLLSRSSRLPLP